MSRDFQKLLENAANVLQMPVYVAKEVENTNQIAGLLFTLIKSHSRGLLRVNTPHAIPTAAFSI